MLGLWLIVSLGLAAEIDRGSSGTIVTIRPEGDERVEIVDGEGVVLAMPPDLPAEIWLVNAEAWREAVARVVELQPFEALVEEQADLLSDLEGQVAAERAARSAVRLDLEVCTAREKEIRRNGRNLALAGLVVGLVAGASAVAVVAF